MDIPNEGPDVVVPGAAGSAAATWRALMLGATAVALTGVAGVAVVARLRAQGYGVPRLGLDAFFLLYATHERPLFVLAAVFASLVAIYAWYCRSSTPSLSACTVDHTHKVARAISLMPVLAVAVVVGTVAALGGHLLLHDFPLSADEYNAVFQARIFSAGRISAQLPPIWWPFGAALTPVWVTYYPEVHSWRSGYLPVYATIRALLDVVGLSRFTNPLLGALTVPALVAAGRRLWPARPQRVVLAAIFLVTSSQFLFMSMTWYSMPAHLLLNVVWLWLYLRGDRLSLALVPIVGVLALGLHNPFPHALFVIPFLVRMLRRRRFAWLAYAVAIYAAGSALWLSWIRHSYSYQQGGGLLSTFALPDSWGLRTQAAELSLLLSWQAPFVVVAAAVALLRWNRLTEPERDLAAGMFITAGFFFFFPSSQVHGWGNRYFYSVLANLFLLAAAGTDLCGEALGQLRIGRIVGVSTAVALLAQIPLRAVQAERFVAPFARANAYVAARPEPVVVIYTDSSYYAHDLVRNDPFLRNSPKLISADALGDSGLRRLRARFGRGVHVLRPSELAPLGVPTF